MATKPTRRTIKQVIVVVEGGVVQSVNCPRGVRVIVKDYDCDGAPTAHRDKNKDYYERTEYDHGGCVQRGK